MILRGDHNQCAACSLYFNSTKAFDRHRRGTPGKARRCLSTDEMREVGMSVNSGGWWITRAGGPLHFHRDSVGGDQPISA
jgi:hypothetical protein